MMQKLKIFLLLQLVIQVIILLGDHGALAIATCTPGSVPFGDECDECGLSNFVPNVRAAENETSIEEIDIEARIVGGVEATAHSFPAQVLIVETTANGWDNRCGGTLIRRNIIVTSIRCLINIQTSTSFRVYLGLHDRTNLNAPGVFSTTIKKFYVHPKFIADTHPNDIVIGVLSEPATLTDKIQIACLPRVLSRYYPITNTEAWIVGWGVTDDTYTEANTLQNAKIQVLDGMFCSRYDAFNILRMICGGTPDGSKNACVNDHGGPFYIKATIGGKKRLVLAGIYSYGEFCAQRYREYPGMYTRISTFVPWINRVIKLSQKA